MRIEKVKNTLKEFKTIITIILIVLLALVFVRIVANINICQIIINCTGSAGFTKSPTVTAGKTVIYFLSV